MCRGGKRSEHCRCINLAAAEGSTGEPFAYHLARCTGAGTERFEGIEDQSVDLEQANTTVWRFLPGQISGLLHQFEVEAPGESRSDVVLESQDGYDGTSL